MNHLQAKTGIVFVIFPQTIQFAPTKKLYNSSLALSLDEPHTNLFQIRRLRLHQASEVKCPHSTTMEAELFDKWKAIVLKVANSVVGVSGFALLLYSLWMIGVCIREGRFSWFMFACIVTGSTLCVIASLGYLGASGIGSGVLLSCYIFLMFMVLTVEILVGADVILNKHWKKDFPKDKTKMFDDFVDYVEHNYGVFRLIWILLALSQVTSFGLAMVLKFSANTYRAKLNYERLPLMDNQPRFISNKYAEY